MEIRTVSNGFVINHNGQESIAKTLLEAAEIMGEYTPASKQYTRYRYDKTKYDLSQVVMSANRGHKIDAIKMLRDCFEPRLGLLEAKEIVEVLIGK
jgi:ribosomal protein L7/L12